MSIIPDNSTPNVNRFKNLFHEKPAKKASGFIRKCIGLQSGRHHKSRKEC